MRLGLVASLLCLCTVSLCLADPAKAAIRKDLNVPPESLSPALQQVATTYELQVLYPTQVAKDLKTHGAVGFFTPDDALKAVLSGTGLSYKYLDANTVTVFSTAAPAGVTAAEQDQTNTTQDNSKEAGKKSSQDFRVAQADQGQTSSPSTVEDHAEQPPKKKPVLEEVVVTGSRIPTRTGQGPQAVQVYTRAQIDLSGQTTAAAFLNTLPSVSVISGESTNTPFGGTTVQLRGLPFGTTLVLINGRRLQTSGTQAGTDFFDLNNIPAESIDRIEVVAEGSSAIYGSDAIAGVVNIILRKNLDGFETSFKYGSANGFDESNTMVSWGKTADRGAFSIVGSYQSRSELQASQRPLTASQDYTPYGGPNKNYPMCNPGNVYSSDGVTPLPGLGTATYAAVPARFSGTPSIQEFVPTAGTLNECSLFTAGRSLIPATHRAGVFAQGSYELASKVELFAELLVSHLEQIQHTGTPRLFGVLGFQTYTVGASNPYNPFGVAVGVSESFPQFPQGQFEYTTFVRPVVGIRGKFDDWEWEVSALQSEDMTNSVTPNTISNGAAIQAALNSSNPATALNPFVPGLPASASEVQSFFSAAQSRFTGRGQSLQALLRGTLFRLPSGPIQVVLGSSYDRDTLSSDLVVQNPAFASPNPYTINHRDSVAIFTEARIPVLAAPADRSTGDTLAMTLAGRYDRYSDFGSKKTPQLGAEWRPLESVLVRATYAEAFKAPSLYDLYSPVQTIPGGLVLNDPQTGQSGVIANQVVGGNPSLRAPAGQSTSFGFVYSSRAIPDLQVSVTQWRIEETNAIESIDPQLIVDDPGDFPGRIIRGAGLNGQPGPILTVIDTLANFGSFTVAGVDYHVNYQYKSAFGTWTPSLNITQTYRYRAALIPTNPPTDRLSKANDDGAWAPRWKGTIALGWARGPYAVGLTGRYVSSYEDYESLPNGTTQTLGNFWLLDGNARVGVGDLLGPNAGWSKTLYVEFGGVNVLNRTPQYSTKGGSLVGYDPLQADILGRLLYAKVGLKF
jgi:iron complex outermembrane receptor protein